LVDGKNRMPRHVINRVLTILTGFCLYILLCFIPLIGPLIAGFYIGGRAKSVRNGLFMAFTSALLGFFTLSLFIFPNAYENILPGMVYMLWQTLSIISMMVGAVIGSMIQGVKGVIDMFNYQRVGSAVKPGPAQTVEKEDAVKTYVICPACGEPNEGDRRKCRACGSEI